ncbi:hypothetical protein T11_4025 [Trichinella zimbabwensis]|uniref:Uncharacterized protein n=1 Tax=Trichinella zimbabwensis TaxID=268475 RepID=A0A0V1HR28_9BILA|nr:hypothetical protein T11_4025 [Trichinella zimbabwensis]
MNKKNFIAQNGIKNTKQSKSAYIKRIIYTFLCFLGLGPSSGRGVSSVIEIIFNPDNAIPFIEDARPGPNPLSTTRALVIPLLKAFKPAAMPVDCPATSVFFLQFLKPSNPQVVIV